MFTLTEQLPWDIQINGKKYKIDLSFDNVLRVIDLLNDDEIHDIRKITAALELLLEPYPILPFEEQIKLLIEILEKFINENDEDDIEYDIVGNPMPKTKNEGDNVDVYDLKQDAQYIYASFMQDYRIDLFEQQGKMHWWQFKALLHGLRDDTKFKKVLEIRTMELPSGKGMEKQREAIRKLKKVYALKPRES